MAKTEMIRARMEPELKRGAEAIFDVLGLSPTEAITLFYKQVTLRRGLPFSVEIPNAETLEAMRTKASPDQDPRFGDAFVPMPRQVSSARQAGHPLACRAWHPLGDLSL